MGGLFTLCDWVMKSGIQLAGGGIQVMKRRIQNSGRDSVPMQ